jgi:hypothetical protein
MKFSESPKMNGTDKQIMPRPNDKIMAPILSFHEWNEWNGTLSALLLIPNGLEDPV